jgi:hypothetical protein
MKAVDVSAIENVVYDGPVGVVDDRAAPRKNLRFFSQAFYCSRWGDVNEYFKTHWWGNTTTRDGRLLFSTLQQLILRPSTGTGRREVKRNRVGIKRFF